MVTILFEYMVLHMGFKHVVTVVFEYMVPYMGLKHVVPIVFGHLALYMGFKCVVTVVFEYMVLYMGFKHVVTVVFGYLALYMGFRLLCFIRNVNGLETLNLILQLSSHNTKNCLNISEFMLYVLFLYLQYSVCSIRIPRDLLVSTP